jgi:phage-related minor tail protein
MTNEEYVTKILERVGPIIDVVGLFLVIKKIQEDEREAIEKRVMELDETMATRANVINKAIRARGQE